MLSRKELNDAQPRRLVEDGSREGSPGGDHDGGGGRPLPDFTPRRSTRIIVRFADEDLEYDAMFERYGRALGAGGGAALLSSPNAVGAERLPRALDLMASFALSWKDAGMTVHLELGEYPVPGALEKTLRTMAGSVTSIGLNFNELRSIGLEPTALEAQMAAFAERHGVTRLVIHADHWALALTREKPERELDALAMGCLLASARAEAGRPVDEETFTVGPAMAQHPAHLLEPCLLRGVLRVQLDDACDTAHRRCVTSARMLFAVGKVRSGPATPVFSWPEP